MATTEHTPSKAFSHERMWWGELIYGYREDIQALGIAHSAPFPGELRGPKTQLSTVDKRGLRARISRAEYMEKNGSNPIYCVHIRYPGRERIEFKKFQFAPGVTLQPSWWWDEYTGNAESLIVAGLVHQSDLPGQPNRNKYRVSLTADGIVFAKPKGYSRGNEYELAGAKSISRVGPDRYRVNVWISHAEGKSRFDILNEIEREFETRCKRLNEQRNIGDMPENVEPPVLFAPKFWVGQRLRHRGVDFKVTSVQWSDKWVCEGEPLPSGFGYKFDPCISASGFPIVENSLYDFEPIKARVMELPTSTQKPFTYTLSDQPDRAPACLNSARHERSQRSEKLKAIREQIRVSEQALDFGQKKLNELLEQEHALIRG
jgi:hypothetical protein